MKPNDLVHSMYTAMNQLNAVMTSTVNSAMYYYFIYSARLTNITIDIILRNTAEIDI